ncbi:MAG: hypothetical protein JSS10_08380 [Verrucomicrobia bacterium]|nr:hypothetical protein [Verrucomicrobiota bacterium]
MSIISNLAGQLQPIALMYEQERQYAYQELAHDFRDFALILASRGRFEEALDIVQWARSEGLEPDNETLWSGFYIGVAKVILVYENCLEASRAFNNRKLHIKFLENVVYLFQEPDISKLKKFLKFEGFKDKIV